ncbi:MAG: ADP-glyceromanno-heptose 6-epimerase [Chlamydiota bacterium]|jgi:ADP-L-glycero-D-manno-heptose 6-epimerase
MKQDQIFTDQYIVVTGAAGFIGSGVVRHLNDQGLENLILVDDFKDSSKWKNLLGKKFVDIISKHKLFDWLEGRESEIEAFIHLGACSSTVEADADFLMENNYRYSLRLAEYALKNEHRFIYASSAATYGKGENGFKDEHSILDDLRPLNAYGYSKHLFDIWLARQKVLDKVIGLKYFNVFGPNEYHKGRMASMVYHIFNTIQKEGWIGLFKSSEPEKYKDGDQVRDFIYVKDAVRMTCNMLDKAFKDVTGIYNVGRGETVTWNKIAEAVFHALDKKVDIRYIDMPKDLEGQYQNFTLADMSKYATVQGHKLQTAPIEESIREYVQEYLIPGKRW